MFYRNFLSLNVLKNAFFSYIQNYHLFKKITTNSL